MVGRWWPQRRCGHMPTWWSSGERRRTTWERPRLPHGTLCPRQSLAPYAACDAKPTGPSTTGSAHRRLRRGSLSTTRQSRMRAWPRPLLSRGPCKRATTPWGVAGWAHGACQRVVTTPLKQAHRTRTPQPSRWPIPWQARRAPRTWRRTPARPRPSAWSWSPTPP